MGRLSARLFGWVQSAPFYRELYSQAVALLPAGAGRTWVDVGCGPGLVAGLAAARGYTAWGLDRDPAMVALARRHHPAARFAVGDLFAPVASQPHPPGADVVSAASLLAVLPDRRSALQALLARVRPGGTLLLIEPSPSMTPASAAAWLARHPAARGATVLRLWAHTRRPQRAVQAHDLHWPGWDAQAHPLLEGLVQAWLLRASQPSPPSPP